MIGLHPRCRLLLSAALLLILAACNSSNEQRYQGWVEADLLFIGPDDPGRLESLAVREGAAVNAGAPLFTLDAELQQADLRAATAAAAEARARLERLEAAQQRPAEVAVLQSQEQRMQAALALSTAELERQKTLADRGFTPKAQLDTAQANFNRDKAALEEVRNQILVARMASRQEDIAAASQAVAAATARHAAAQTRLERRRVASPATGSVQQIYYRPGELVPAGRPAVALLPPGNVKIRFFAPEPILPKITAGDRVRVRCDGCAEEMTARVDFIARTAEFTPPVIYSLEERSKLVYLIEARPERPDGLRVGQPVSVALDAATGLRR